MKTQKGNKIEANGSMIVSEVDLQTIPSEQLEKLINWLNLKEAHDYKVDKIKWLSWDTYNYWYENIY